MPTAVVNCPAADGSHSHEVVPAQRRGIRVLAVHIMADADVLVHFTSATTPISAQMPVAARGGFVITATGYVVGWFATTPGEALNLVVEGVANVGCTLVWASNG